MEDRWKKNVGGEMKEDAEYWKTKEIEVQRGDRHVCNTDPIVVKTNTY